MKLVFIGPTYPSRGGIARYGTYLLARLQEKHDCLGLGFDRLYPAFLFPGQEQVDSRPLPAGGARALNLLHYRKAGAWKKAACLIEEFAPQAVVLSWWVSFWAPHTRWLVRRISRTCPVIFLCHNVLPHESRFFDAPLIRWALRPGQGFIVHSQDDRSRLLDWFPNASVVCREHPVFPLDTVVNFTREEARSRLNVTGRMLLFFGFVRTYKGLDVAIEALSLLEADYDDLTLWVAGEFWEDSKRYYRQIEKLGLGDRIRIEPEFLPEDELALRLAACDGVILPYRSATGSGVLGSAYASGRPVIATRTGCFKEMVIPESTGILCDSGDAQCLAQAIREFYQGEGPARFQAGVAEAAKRFSWDRILDAIEELAHVR